MSEKTDRDMSVSEYTKMLSKIGTLINIRGTRNKPGKDVAITILRQSAQRTRFLATIYVIPNKYNICLDDRCIFYPMFKAEGMKKRLYLVKDSRGYKLAITSNGSAFRFIQTCYGELEYFDELLETGVEHINADWKFDNSANLPYIEIEEGK